MGRHGVDNELMYVCAPVESGLNQSISTHSCTTLLAVSFRDHPYCDEKHHDNVP